MRSNRLLAYCAMLSLAAPAPAALHLGMKLACKKYGDALSSANRSALIAACTPDFGRQWARMSNDMLAAIPKAGGGEVVSSTKDATGGTVTVSTRQGMVTFVLVGSGFTWHVADMYKPSDDGGLVSVKSYLDVTMTSRELMTNLKHVGGKSYYASLTPEFQNAFQKWTPAQINRIRDFLPDPKTKAIPVVRLTDSHATVCCRLPSGGEKDSVTFHLVQRNGWKVEDFSIQSRTTYIASFRSALPMLVASTSFGDYILHPRQTNPERFTLAGALRDALLFARTQTPFCFPQAGKPIRFTMAGDHQSVELVYVDRRVRLTASNDPAAAGKLVGVEAHSAGAWADVAQMLLLKQKLQEYASVQGWLDRIAAKPKRLPSFATPPRATLTASVASTGPAASAVVTTNVNATDAPAAEPPSEAEPIPTAAVPAKAVAASSGRVGAYVIRATGYRPSPAQMTRKELRRARNIQ